MATTTARKASTTTTTTGTVNLARTDAQQRAKHVASTASRAARAAHAATTTAPAPAPAPAPATPPAPTTATTPVGTTTTTTVGQPQATVPALAHVVATLGVVLASPQAPWGGYGKAVRLAGGGSAYVNRGNVDVRATPGTVAAWAAAGHGTVRGPQGQYLRVAYSGSGNAH